MGYDLYLLDPPERLEPQRRLHREARKRCEALRDRPRDDPEYRAAWDAYEATPDPAYLELNVAGMACVRAAIDAAGMIASEGAPAVGPDWRSLPAETLDGRQFHPDHYYPDEVCTPEQIAYMEELDRWRRYRPEGNVGIQSWKLRSNDYWIVTAPECAEALEAWGALPPQRQQVLLGAVAALDIEESDPSFREWREVLMNAFDAMGERHAEDPPPVVIPEGHRTTVAEFVATWDAWLDFLRLGADGDGFMVE